MILRSLLIVATPYEITREKCRYFPLNSSNARWDNFDMGKRYCGSVIFRKRATDYRALLQRDIAGDYGREIIQIQGGDDP